MYGVFRLDGAIGRYEGYGAFFGHLRGGGGGGGSGRRQLSGSVIPKRIRSFSDFSSGGRLGSLVMIYPSL